MSEKFIPIENLLKPSRNAQQNADGKFSKFSPLGNSEKNSDLLDSSIVHASIEPIITINREGNRVTSILLKCPCGREFRLNCVYTVPVS